MKKVSFCLMCFLVFLLCNTAYAGNRYITTGGGLFAPTEKLLDQATAYQERGQACKLWALIDSGRVKVFPPNKRARIVTYGNHKLRVKVPRTSRTVWWTTRDALMLKGQEHLAR